MHRNILVVGSGAREHALAWKLRQSVQVRRVHVAPGNAGTQLMGAANVAIEASDVAALIEFAKDANIDTTVVGPDAPLAEGIVDAFTAAGLRIFGPTKAAAQIESSKSWAKNLMIKLGIPRGPFEIAQSFDTALLYVRQWNGNVVIKRDGLCFGKGAFVCTSMEEATVMLDALFPRDALRISNELVIIEKRLAGPEVSAHAFCDGKSARLMPLAKDYKRRFDGGVGPNTGGMGAVAHEGSDDDEGLARAIDLQTVIPAITGLHSRNTGFKGVLYPGIMITGDGIKVLEYNARFGDPEGQTLLRLLRTDLLAIIDACIDGTLANLPIVWDDGYAVCVVLVDRDYPEKTPRDTAIHGFGLAESDPRVVIFHGATRWRHHDIAPDGGRILSVTATGATLEEARTAASAAAEKITFDGKDCRSDIGLADIGE